MGEAVPPYQFGHGKDISDFINPCQSCPLESCIINCIFRRHGSRMGSRYPGRFREPPGLVYNDGFLSCESPGCSHKFPRVLDRFDVKYDAMRIFILPEIINKVTKLNIDTVSDWDKIWETNFPLNGPVQDRSTQCSWLRDKRYVAMGRHLSGKACVELQWGDNNPQAVRAKDPHSFKLPDLITDLPFKHDPGFTGLLKACRNNDDPPYPCFSAFPYDSRDFRSRGADDPQIGGFGKPFYVRVTRYAHDRFVLRIHRVNHPPESPAYKVYQYFPADWVWIRGNPDQSDPFGIEDIVELVDVHSFFANRVAKIQEFGGINYVCPWKLSVYGERKRRDFNHRQPPVCRMRSAYFPTIIYKNKCRGRDLPFQL